MKKALWRPDRMRIISKQFRCEFSLFSLFPSMYQIICSNASFLEQFTKRLQCVVNLLFGAIFFFSGCCTVKEQPTDGWTDAMSSRDARRQMTLRGLRRDGRTNGRTDRRTFSLCLDARKSRKSLPGEQSELSIYR